MDMDIEKSIAVEMALEIAFRFGQIEGDHHKAWVIDQMIRSLLRDRYYEWVEDYEDNGNYVWDVGIAP